MKTTLVSQLANLLDAMRRCNAAKEDPQNWGARHEERATRLTKEFMPSGGGFDAGTQLVLDKCKDNRIVFATSIHHMDEHGGYDGWTEHEVIVTPDLISGFDMRITGRNRNEVKDYIYYSFVEALNKEIDAMELFKQWEI